MSRIGWGKKKTTSRLSLVVVVQQRDPSSEGCWLAHAVCGEITAMMWTNKMAAIVSAWLVFSLPRPPYPRLWRWTVKCSLLCESLETSASHVLSAVARTFYWRWVEWSFSRLQVGCDVKLISASFSIPTRISITRQLKWMFYEDGM